MKRYSVDFKKSNYLPAVLFLLCVAVLTLSWLPSNVQSQQPRENGLTIINETESLQLVSLKKEDRLVALRLKNTSSKAITAYTFGYHDGFRTTMDKILGDSAILPGEIEEVNIPLSHLSSGGKLPPEQQTLTIVALVFEDRSGEGDFKGIKDILDDRLGQKMQLKRINRLLGAALKSDGTNEIVMLSRLKDQIALLSEEREPKQPLAVYLGMRYMKKHVLQMLGDLEKVQRQEKDVYWRAEFGEKGKTNVREALVSIKELHDKRLAKL